jgi:hypothetical protein
MELIPTLLLLALYALKRNLIEARVVAPCKPPSRQRYETVAQLVGDRFGKKPF